MAAAAPAPRFYKCVMCKRHPKQKDRRTVNVLLSAIMKRHFLIEDTEGVICKRCAHKCYKLKPTVDNSSDCSKALNTHQSSDPDFCMPSSKKFKSLHISSPPSVTLPFPSTSKSHSYCFICKKPGPKLVVAPTHARFIAFLRNEIFVPSESRCCPGHLSEGVFTPDSIARIQQISNITKLNRSAIMELLQKAKEFAIEKEKSRIDFDDQNSLSDEDYKNLTGLNKEQLADLITYIKDIKPSKSRSIRTCVAILLTKLKTSLDNRMLGTLFNMTKSQIRRAVAAARSALSISFVPHFLGFHHISREEVIGQHTRPLAKELFSDVTSDPAILVLDGTYIYIQKSGNFTFQRRSFSMHKHRPLVKPMIIVTTTGYIVAVLGPYLADNKNNDARILNHMIATNAQELRSWLQENDVFVVDRGFRDSSAVLEDLGIKMEMPAFLPKGSKQHPTEEANSSRLVTKVRWVVESVNGRIKTWRYLNRTLPNSQIPYIGDYVRIVCALCNAYRGALSTGDQESDCATAAKMLYLARKSNSLKQRVEEEGLDKRPYTWRKINASDSIVHVAPYFPRYTEEELRELTIGVYQLKMAKSYTQEHFDDEGGYEISISDDVDDVISAKLQSRHVSSKKYTCWIGHADGAVTSWFCKCKTGARVVGACAHITSILWYLSYARHLEKIPTGVQNWGDHIADASSVPELVDDSDSDCQDDVTEE